MKKRIALDMDEVIADINSKYLDIFEKELGKRPEKKEYWGKKLYKLHPEAMKFRQNLFEKGFFRDLPVIKGSQEGVKALMEHYEVFITTAASEFKNSLGDKHEWLQEHFPFIHWKNFVFCGDKSIIRADYMIDDHANNLESFQGKGLLFTASHNISENRFTRVNNWEEVVTFFEKEKTLV